MRARRPRSRQKIDSLHGLLKPISLRRLELAAQQGEPRLQVFKLGFEARGGFFELDPARCGERHELLDVAGFQQPEAKIFGGFRIRDFLFDHFLEAAEAALERELANGGWLDAGGNQGDQARAWADADELDGFGAESVA